MRVETVLEVAASFRQTFKTKFQLESLCKKPMVTIYGTIGFLHSDRWFLAWLKNGKLKIED
ncbi:MAG: hypothetical protein IKI83_04400 [Prevotella sp.]|nr:hypothetical protein [Prevotella sp.]